MWLFATASLIVVALFLFRFPRQTLIVLGAVAAIIALGGAYFWWHENGRQRYVDVKVSFSPTSPPCSAQFPLRLEVANRSGSAVNSFSLSIAAYSPGRSTNIAPYQPGAYKSDQIIDPGRMLTICYSAPKLTEDVDPATAVWDVDSKYVYFRD
jgi:hypothetical protein